MGERGHKETEGSPVVCGSMSDLCPPEPLESNGLHAALGSLRSCSHRLEDAPREFWVTWGTIIREGGGFHGDQIAKL